MSFDYGPLRLCVGGHNPVAELLRAELGDDGATAGVDILITVTTNRRHQSEPSAGSVVRGRRLPFTFVTRSGADGLTLGLGVRGFRQLYEVHLQGSLEDSSPLTLNVALPPSLRLMSNITRPLTVIGTRDASSLVALAAKNVLYEIVDPLAWIRLLGKDSTMLHASAISDSTGDAHLFLGHGGVGKSTVVLRLMEHPSFRYLSDDIVIFGPGSKAHRHPKKLQIYEYNLRTLPSLRPSVTGRLGLAKRVLWRARAAVLGPAASRARVAAADLFGSTRLAPVAPVTRATWLSATDDDHQSQPTPMEKELIAEKATTALLEEFWDFLRLLNMAALTDHGPRSIGEISEATRDVVSRNLMGVATYHAAVPQGLVWDPAVLLSS